MKKKLIIAAVTALCVLLLLFTFLRMERKDDEIRFTAIVTQVDLESNTAYAQSAIRNPKGNLWDKLLEKQLPNFITFDTGDLDVTLNEWDVITGYYTCGSVDGKSVHVSRITSAVPGDVKYFTHAKSIINAIALGNMDEAWSCIYQEKAATGLKDSLEACAELLSGNEVKRFDQYKCEKSGDFESENGIYTETTYYKIYVFTDDFSGEPDYYAKITARKDSTGEGIISLKIYTIDPVADNSNSWAVAAHFYFDGKGYFYHGKLTYELPEGYEYVADVINVGDAFSGNDFEGNVDGKIYMNEAASDVAYFSWEEWNEEIDGPAPFLKLELKENG